MRDSILLESIEEEVKKATTKAEIATTLKTKLAPLSKALIKLKDFKSQAHDSTLLDDLEKSLSSLLHQTQLNSFLEAANKAEFKNQKKKALDQYYEALYFLKNDDIDDSFQTENISSIEAKVIELVGKIE